MSDSLEFIEGYTDTKENWITARITDARKGKTLVSDAVSARIEILLNGQFTERQLTSAELKTIAGLLVADMIAKAGEPKKKK